MNAIKIAFTLLALGIGLLIYADSLPAYKDEKWFYLQKNYGNSEDYWKLRDEMLTPKYSIQDYGITLIASSLFLFFFARSGRLRFEEPKWRATLVALAVVTPFLDIGGYVFDLSQGMLRREFPPWADSLGIPLSYVPSLLIVALIWTIGHLVFMKRVYAPSAPLALAISRKANKWLSLVSVVTVAGLISLVSLGQYWYAIPWALWLYFHLSLAAARRAVDEAPNVSQGDLQPDFPGAGS